MMSIFGVNTAAAQPLAGAGKMQGAPNTEKPEEKDQSRLPKPMMDEYVPGEPQEPSGRYWMGKDEGGQLKVYFDDPELAADEPPKPEGAPDAKDPEKEGEKEERWVCDTDKVDREIENLKKEQRELKQRLGTEADETKSKDLERQLAQVERELGEKDNDTYRKQHSTFTQL